MPEFDTIVAPATPVGRSALAIVRVDGASAFSIVQELSGVENPVARVATLVRLQDSGELLDEAVVIFYPAPHSFTGNDLVEVSLHGNPWLISRLLEAVISRGARMAEAGEFTERAVLNGKMDLTQAEAVGELIDSRTRLQARVSLRQLEGGLRREAEGLREMVVSVISRLEAALDFAEEGYEFIGRDEAISVVEKGLGAAARLRATYDRGRATVEGITAVILGKPNAGKSTLLNFLCGTDRAIVTPVPGTTRDLLREVVEIGGLPVTVIDTAGIREQAGEVEEIGISRARQAAAEADIVLYLVDAAAGLDEADRKELERHPEAIVIYAKADLAPAPDGARAISVKEAAGIEELLGGLDERVRESFAAPETSAVIVNERQRRAVEECAAALDAALDSLRSERGEEVVLVDLNRAARALGLLTGEITHEEIIAEIFAKFCIGK